LAISRAVIEAAESPESIITVILEPGILRDLTANSDELVENLIEPVLFLQAPFADQFPRFLTYGAIGLLEVTRHLRQRLFFSLEAHRQRPGYLLILLAQLGVFSFQRHILRTKQFHLEAGIAIEHLVSAWRQLAAD